MIGTDDLNTTGIEVLADFHALKQREGSKPGIVTFSVRACMYFVSFSGSMGRVLVRKIKKRPPYGWPFDLDGFRIQASVAARVLDALAASAVALDAALTLVSANSATC